MADKKSDATSCGSYPEPGCSIHVRRLDTREIVSSICVTGKSERTIERIMMVMLINMNTDEYFIDDDEVEQRELNKLNQKAHVLRSNNVKPVVGGPN